MRRTAILRSVLPVRLKVILLSGCLDAEEPNNFFYHNNLPKLLGSVSSPLCVCETWKLYIVKHNCVTQVYLMAKWTTTCFGPYWPSSGCLKSTGLGSYYMHCARTVVQLAIKYTSCDTVVFDYIQFPSYLNFNITMCSVIPCCVVG